MIKIFFDIELIGIIIGTVVSLCFIGSGLYIWFLYFSVGRKMKTSGSDFLPLAFATLLIFIGVLMILLLFQVVVFIPVGG